VQGCQGSSKWLPGRASEVTATARFTHAIVTLNDKPFGLYALKEGYDGGFLEVHFGNRDGNFYDGGFLTDIGLDAATYAQLAGPKWFVTLLGADHRALFEETRREALAIRGVFVDVGVSVEVCVGVAVGVLVFVGVFVGVGVMVGRATSVWVAPATAVFLGGAGITALYLRQWRWLAGLCVGFLPVFSMALHNWVYGHVFVLFSANAEHAAVLVMPPSAYVAAMHELLRFDFGGEHLVGGRLEHALDDKRGVVG
jgi:hypothetical protein